MFFRVLAACAFAGPVLADCPTAADLDVGIRATLTDGAVEEYRNIAPGLVEMIGHYPDDFTEKNVLGQGVYLIAFAELALGAMVPESVVTYDYGLQPDALPLPQEGLEWGIDVVSEDMNGRYEEHQTHAWGGIMSQTYGDCTYQVIPGYLVYSVEGVVYEEGVDYLPELGLGLLVATRGPDEQDYVRYAYRSFEVMKRK